MFNRTGSVDSCHDYGPSALAINHLADNNSIFRPSSAEKTDGKGPSRPSVLSLGASNPGHGLPTFVIVPMT